MMNRLKLFGERITTRASDSQTVEIQIRIAIMNRFSALGRAEIVQHRHALHKMAPLLKSTPSHRTDGGD